MSASIQVTPPKVFGLFESFQVTAADDTFPGVLLSTERFCTNVPEEKQSVLTWPAYRVGTFGYRGQMPQIRVFVFEWFQA
jgi:hypothetical protein